ncbi:hypothetical protein KHQ81_06580 [Mycoplasmatota bacterium]|nr:hypothetical protein KHQ81_06580 [Mycoplasmatota bacterium]
MFNVSEYEFISKKYFDMVKTRSTKSKLIWTPIFIIYVGIMIGLLFIPDFITSEPWKWLYPIYGGLIFIGLLITIIWSYFGVSEKPAFNYLYKEVYAKINLENRSYYSYIPYEKIKNSFNKNGGIFSRYCRPEVKRHVSGTLRGGKHFDIYDLLLITNNGKNRQVHFNGTYFVIENHNPSLLQVRSKGRPHKKGGSYNKIEDITDIKVYLEKEKMLSNTELKYVQVVKQLKEKLDVKKIYLSLTENEIHLAIEPIEKMRKQKNLSVDKLNEIYDYFVNELNIIEEIVTIEAY